MVCITPQFLLDRTVVDCGCCDGCLQAKSNADRARKFYWARRKKGA